MIQVAVAVIFDETQQQVLLTRRPLHVSQGGLWEFPGGKLKPDEQPLQALHREIKEELDIDVLKYQFLDKVSYSYTDKQVDLWVFSVFQYKGTPHCCEAQLALNWAPINKLEQYQFPAANQQIIQLISSATRSL